MVLTLFECKVIIERCDDAFFEQFSHERGDAFPMRIRKWMIRLGRDTMKNTDIFFNLILRKTGVERLEN